MKLDRTTYEAWLLDRIEGRLTHAEERELDAFLAANPELEAPTGDLPVVDGSPLPFDMKEGIKKNFPPTGGIDASRLNDFLVALHEGDLTGPQVIDLERYLYEHPEAARDAELMRVSRVQDGPLAFGEKGSIARHFPPHGMPDKHRLTDFLIASLEGDLTREQQAALDAYLLAHPEVQRERRLVMASRAPLESIVFTGKEQLKRKEGRVVPMWTRYAAAASVALLLGLAWWLLRDGDSAAPEFARKEQVKPVVVPDHSEEVSPHVPANEPLREEVAVPQRPESGIPREGRGSQSGDPRVNPEPGAPSRAQPPVERIAPVQEPQLARSPGKEPQPEVAPVLAQDPVLLPAPGPETRKENDAPALAASGQPAVGAPSIPTLLANTVRNELLETEERTTGLDRNDALAMVDKGLSAITGGQGGVEVQHAAGRERWKLRLGGGLTVSASRGR